MMSNDRIDESRSRAVGDDPPVHAVETSGSDLDHEPGNLPITSLKVLRLLSSRNVALLNLIARHRPSSLTELSKLSGRPKASLTRTMRRFTNLGIVTFKKAKGKGKAPILTCRSVRIEIALDQPVKTEGAK